MSVFSHIDFDHHEQVVYGHDKASGLRAIIAIHNSNLGPALGGCRMWNYANDDEALRDVLRLSPRGPRPTTPPPPPPPPRPAGRGGAPPPAPPGPRPPARGPGPRRRRGGWRGPAPGDRR